MAAKLVGRKSRVYSRNPCGFRGSKIYKFEKKLLKSVQSLFQSIGQNFSRTDGYFRRTQNSTLNGTNSLRPLASLHFVSEIFPPYFLCLVKKYSSDGFRGCFSFSRVCGHPARDPPSRRPVSNPALDYLSNKKNHQNGSSGY